MERYAFIDVQNTDTTTKQLLGFEIDWFKLRDFLKYNWKCKKVFFYIGIDEGDLEKTSMVEKLKEENCIVRDKIIFAYKNKDREIKILCPSCGNNFIERINMGYNRKSNCDVDLTVDAMETGGSGKEFYIFTGDGDFEFLVRKLNEKGTKIHMVSSSKKIKSGPNYFTSRFSTKLRKLIANNPNLVDFLNIDNIRFNIQK